MSDIALNWTDSLTTTAMADIAISADDLVAEDGLRTSVIISLFTDARATKEQAPDQSDLRGYWGDVEPPKTGHVTGSLLWTLERSKQIPDTLRAIEQYARDALKWMIEDGVASDVKTTAISVRRGVWGLTVEIFRPAQQTQKYQFSGEWDAEAAR